jgi:hypothetical protein
MYTKILNINDYLSVISSRLKGQKFKVKENVNFQDQFFIETATRTRFEYVAFCKTIFLISYLDSPDIIMLKKYSSTSFNFSKKIRGILPPLGILYGVRCIPVAIVNSIDENTSRSVRFDDPPKHWAAPEKLVVFSLSNNKLHYWVSSFTPDCLDADLDRKIINEILSP